MRPFTLERLSRMFAVAPRNTFWRHDVDVSPAAALAMANFEQVRGVRATFYVMTTSPFYTAEEAFELALKVSALGHRVGCHIDTRAGDTPPPDALVSFHCPTPDLLWRKFDRFQSAYGPVWKDRYVSDSRGRFEHGDPEDRFGGEALQINLHPEHWFDPNWADRVDPATFRRFFHIPHPSECAA